MALTASAMLDLGTPAPNFTLPEPGGHTWSLDDFRGAKAYLIMFICNHCPYVQHVADQLASVARHYQQHGVAVIAINSNDAEAYPEDSPDKMIEFKSARGYSFPYLYDETQDVARAYHAACTPDFYVFDKDRRLTYRGQMDNSRPDTGISVDGKDLRAALEAVLAGQPAPTDQKPSMGCSIKWKGGDKMQ